MFCTQCGTPIQPNSRFCSSCGAPAVAGPPVAAPAAAATAPTPPAPVQTRQQTGVPAVPVVPASCLIYLAADEVAPRTGMLTPGQTVPCTEIKVQRKPLSELMMVTAMAALAQSGHITFAVSQRGALFLKRNALHIGIARPAAQDPGGLEGPLLRALTGRQGSDFVEDVVGRAIGEASIDPWGAVVAMAEGAMLRLGLYAEEKRPALLGLVSVTRLVPVCALIGMVRPQSAAAIALLHSWQTSNPALYEQLHDNVKRGIKSRYEAPESDSDSISSD